ncbi:MAG: P-loop NTPase family protein [Candidatus Micrarchaeaceae archaeon]
MIIFGAPGSGKSTLAKDLSKKLNLPHFSLDSIVYLKGWTSKHSDRQIKESMGIIVNKDKWILEGFHRKIDTWILPALDKADFVIILNLDKKALVKRNLKRSIENPFGMHGLVYTGGLIHRAFDYKSKRLNKDIELVKTHRKSYIVLNAQLEVEEFINKLG